MDAVPVTVHLGRPTYDLTTARPVVDSLVCVTCVNNQSRHVNTEYGRRICRPDDVAMSVGHHECGCVLTDGNGIHRHSNVTVTRSDGTKEQAIARMQARVRSCGWSIRPECERCTHFVALHHAERYEGRFSSRMRPSSLLRREVLIGGWCGLPEEGIVNAKGARTHCDPNYGPLPDRNPEPSCASCAFAVRPGEWPNNGLMVQGGTVVKVDADAVESLLSRDHSWVPEAYQERVARRMAQAGIVAGSPGLTYHRARRTISGVRGWYSAVPAEVLELHTETIVVNKKPRDVPVNILVRMPGTSELRLFVHGDEAYRFRYRRAAGWRNRTWFPKKLYDAPVTAGDIIVTVGSKRATVELKLDPWVAFFGIQRTNPQRLFPKPQGPSFAAPRPLIMRVRADCQLCLPHRACDAHARGLREEDRDLFSFRYPAARDPQLLVSKVRPRFSRRADGAVVITDREGTPLPVTVFRAAFQELLARARRLGPEAVTGFWWSWFAALDKETVLVPAQELPPRMPVADYPGSEIPVLQKDGHTIETLPTPGRLEPGMWHCLMHLHGIGGVDLPSRLGWRIPGQGRWDAHQPRAVSSVISADGRRSTSYDLGSDFYDTDVWDHFRSMSTGARIQEAMDAAAASDGTWNPHSGQWRHHAPVELKVLARTRYDLFGAETTDENYPFGYSRFEDARSYRDWLDEDVVVAGTAVSNRRRLYGYDLFVPPKAKPTTDWTSFLVSPGRLEPDRDDLDAFDTGEDDHDDLGPEEEQLGIDIFGAIHEEEVVQYELLDVYCPRCERITTATVAAPGLVPDDDVICPECLEQAVVLGPSMDQATGTHQPLSFCPACHTVFLDAVTPVADSCPECGEPLVAVAERVDDGPEKRAGIQIWRSDDDMIRRQQMERVLCPLWVRRGSGVGDRKVVGLATLERWRMGGRRKR